MSSNGDVKNPSALKGCDHEP